MSAGVSPVPDEAALIESVAKAIASVRWSDLTWDYIVEHSPAGAESFRREAAAALPSLREGIAAEVLGPVRALVGFLDGNGIFTDGVFNPPTEADGECRLAAVRSMLSAAARTVQVDGLCVHCDCHFDEHGPTGACLRAGYYGNRYTSPAPVRAAEVPDRD